MKKGKNRKGTQNIELLDIKKATSSIDYDKIEKINKTNKHNFSGKSLAIKALIIVFILSAICNLIAFILSGGLGNFSNFLGSVAAALLWFLVQDKDKEITSLKAQLAEYTKEETPKN